MIEIHCPTEANTRALGRKLAASLRPGDVVVLAGGLGAGKTTFTAGVATGLGVEEQVVSPSFVLVRQYLTGFIPVFHADVYRLGSLNEFDDLDVMQVAIEGVLMIEWGDALEGVLPEDHLRVQFTVEDDGARLLTLVPNGDWVDRDLELVA